MDLLVVLQIMSLYIKYSLQDMHFHLYDNMKPSFMTAVQEVSNTLPLKCYGLCVRRQDCLAAWITATKHCRLYQTNIANPNTELQTQVGDVFLNLATRFSIIKTLNVLSRTESNTMGFPTLKAPAAGRVIGWKLRCQSAGVAVMIMFRFTASSQYEVIGKTHISITESMVNDVIHYAVPYEDSFMVEAEDFIGYSIVGSTSNPNLYALHWTGNRDGFSGADFLQTIGNSALTDADLSVGNIVTLTGFYQRLPAVGVLIA